MWLGALVAPLSSWATAFAYVLLIGGWSFPDQLKDVLKATGFVGFVSVLVSYVGMVVVGLPFALWLRHRGRLCGIYLALGGFVLGGAAFSLVLGTRQDPARRLEQFMLAGAFGVAVAVSFALLVGAPLRPNNSSKPTPLRGAA